MEGFEEELDAWLGWDGGIGVWRGWGDVDGHFTLVDNGEMCVCLGAFSFLDCFDLSRTVIAVQEFFYWIYT